MEREDHRPKWGQGCSRMCCMPQRVICTIMGFFSLICAFTCRISLSHAITVLAIPKNRTVSNEEDRDLTDVCPAEEPMGSGSKSPGIYDWSEQEQGFILGSFYFGYIISHLPGGILADKYGAKWVLGISNLVTALCAIFSPLGIEKGGAWTLVAIRVIMGLAQGPIFPALSVLLSAWVPKNERGTLGTLCFGGSTAGIIVSNFASGQLLHAFPWPVTFYVFGSLTILWFIIFVFLCSSTPFTHPCIKPKEVNYLYSTIGNPTKDKPPIPWKRMMLSMAMLAVIVSQIGHDWGYYVMITCLPKYMADVLQFSIRSNGLYTALPYIAMWLATLASGVVADWLIRTGKMKLVTERKLFTFLSAFLPGLFMVIASFAGCNKTAAVILFTISMLTMGPYYAGQKLSALDMSPSYSGTIMAIVNGLGSLTGMGAPPVVGALTPHASLGEWRIVFIISFLIFVITALVFVCFGSGDIQSYDPMYEGAQKKDTEKKE